MCPWISVFYPSYYSYITTSVKLKIILNILCFHFVYNDIFFCNHFNLEIIRHYFDKNMLVASFIGAFNSTLYGVLLWYLNKKYHYEIWHATNKQKHELASVKLDPCLNKKELDPALYFHNSIKVLKTEIANFKTSKLTSYPAKVNNDGNVTV